jgi:hypothetical protein
MRLRRIEPLVSTIAHETVALPFPPAAEFSNSPAGMLVQTVQGCLNDAKAEDIVCIDLNGKTALADTMIIATGAQGVGCRGAARRGIGKLRLGAGGRGRCRRPSVPAGSAPVLQPGKDVGTRPAERTPSRIATQVLFVLPVRLRPPHRVGFALRSSTSLRLRCA